LSCPACKHPVLKTVWSWARYTDNTIGYDDSVIDYQQFVSRSTKYWCVKCAGVFRFAYNYGLAKRIKEYQETGKSSNAIDQHKEIVLMKKTEEYKWLKEVSKCIPQESLRNLDKAYANFFGV
jgi:putative transposase